MLFVRSWLEKYINLVGISNAKIAEAITMKSSEVEEITEITDWFGGKVLVGKIQNVRPHPDADRLKVFDVNVGNKSVQIVSAAANVVDGLIVPVALEGAVLPGLTILPKPMRGQKSEGMCCGKSELMLEDGFSVGLWELNNFDEIESKLGMSVCEALPEFFAPQTVFEIKILPDKIGTIGNHLGMALEISQCLNRPDLLLGLAADTVDLSVDWKEKLTQRIVEKSPVEITVHDESKYSNTFCLFELDTKAEYFLPQKATQHMFFASKNLIGGLADVSNYVLHDVGQPNHFFSLEKLQNLANNQTDLHENTAPLKINWTISKSLGGNNFEGLGQLKKTQIPAGVDVLQLADKIIAIPAISGGNSTKMDTTETTAVVEFANFLAQCVARNSFALNYRSEGAKIWAGGVNPRQIILGLISLLENLPANAEMRVITCLFQQQNQLTLKAAISNLLEEKSTDAVVIDYEYIAARLDGKSAKFWQKKIDEILALSGRVQNGVYYKNRFFGAIQTQEDLLHEVGKQVGYENLQKEFLQFSTINHRDLQFDDTISARRIFTKYGFTEVITRPFISMEKVQNVYGDIFDNSLLTLINPYNSTEPHIRPGLLAHLLDAASQNVKAGFKNPQLCELNKVYYKKNGVVAEELVLESVALLDDPYVTTSAVLEILHGLYPDKNIQAKNQLDTIGNMVEYSVDGKKVAWVFEVKNASKKAAEIPLGKRLWASKISLNEAAKASHFFSKYQDETDFPPLKRSYSFLVPSKIYWTEVQVVMTEQKISGSLLSLKPTERFKTEDADVLNVDVKWTSSTRTLTNEEVNEWFTKVEAKLKEIGILVRN